MRNTSGYLFSQSKIIILSRCNSMELLRKLAKRKLQLTSARDIQAEEPLLSLPMLNSNFEKINQYTFKLHGRHQLVHDA